MTYEKLEVRINIEENYQANQPERDRLRHTLEGAEKERYLGGNFGELVSYVAKICASDPELTRASNAIKSRLSENTPQNPVTVVLRDEVDMLPDGQIGTTEIFLDEIVGDKVGDDPQLINIGLQADPGVGYCPR